MLKGIAKRIANLPNLRYLLLANNALEELPAEMLAKAGGLRRMTLTGNKLTKDVMKLEKLDAIGEE